MSDFNIEYTLDDLFSTLPIGSFARAEVNNLYGINHRQISPPIQMNKDMQGFTFFVRPQLNLSTTNVRNIRKLYTLLTTVDKSVPRFVRNTLDPRLDVGFYNGYSTGPKSSPQNPYEKVSCSLVDEKQAFIPILTNNLLSVSGFPDLVTNTFSSKPGAYGEVWSQVDSSIDNYGEYDIDCTFRNIKGDPIIYMFYVWALYMSYVFQGKLNPYPDYIVQNTLDYTTRVYRVILDVDKKTVKKIFATGAAFPISVPVGQFADFNHDKPYSEQNRDFTIRFRCLGMEMFDDILLKEFNQTGIIFNRDMNDGSINSSGDDLTGPRVKNMVKINQGLLHIFNNRGYPRIDPSTNELEWWIMKDVFLRKINQLNNTGLLPFARQNLDSSQQKILDKFLKG